MKILSKNDIKTGQDVTVIFTNPYQTFEAKVLIERDFVFLCSNERYADGGHGGEKLGFKYKWAVGKEINKSYYEMIAPANSSQEYLSNLKIKIENRLRRARRKRELEIKRKQQELIETSDNELVDKVNRYFRTRSNSPLIFKYDYDGEPKSIDITNKDDMEFVLLKLKDEYSTNYYRLRGIDKLVYGTYLASKVCISKDKITNQYRTGRGKRRSSGDIWRHIISTNPEITIFDVMTSLYRLGRGDNRVIGSDYCSDVKKQVFYAYGSSSESNSYQVDEYGTKFDSWKRAKKLYKEHNGS